MKGDAEKLKKTAPIIVRRQREFLYFSSFENRVSVFIEAQSISFLRYQYLKDCLFYRKVFKRLVCKKRTGFKYELGHVTLQTLMDDVYSCHVHLNSKQVELKCGFNNG